MTTDRTARISLDALGGGRIEVNGHDLSDVVQGLTLNAHVGHIPQLIVDLQIHHGEIDGQTVVQIPADTAAILVELGWTPPEDGQPVDLTDPKRHDQMIKIIKAEARRDPDWLRTLLRREARAHGGQAAAPQPTEPPT